MDHKQKPHPTAGKNPDPTHNPHDPDGPHDLGGVQSARAPAVSSSPPSAMVPRPFRVVERHRDTDDIVTLMLRPTYEDLEEKHDRGNGGRDHDVAGSRFAPGQFHMLYAFGVGEVPISISGHPDAPDEPLVHTIRDVGATTRALCTAELGSIVGVRGPFGTAWPTDRARGGDVVFVAGGIGLAPLRPAIYRVLQHRAAYGRVALAYGARRPADLLYQQELERWRTHFDVEVRVTVDVAGSDWFGPVGAVTRELPRLSCDPTKTTAFVCGPEIMMRFSVAALKRRGIQDSRLYLSMERNMQCALGYCGHCQFGPAFVCKDGPVFAYPQIAQLLNINEI